MVNLRLTIVFILISATLFSQVKKIETYSIADCEGAVNIFKSGNYSIQFTGSAGEKSELSKYPSLTDISEKNIVWVSYIAPSDGVLSLNASLVNDYIQMVLFEETEKNICTEFQSGIAEIKRIYKQKDLPTVGLDVNVRSGFLYPLSMIANQKILIGFSTSEKSKGILELSIDYKLTNVDDYASNESKIIDDRSDEFAPSISLLIRDSETKEPILANLTIEGSKELKALYNASDIILNITRSAKISIKCDAEGYFFLDKVVEVIATNDQEIILEMQPVKKGSSIQLEEIEFKAGTSEFMPGSEGKLNRLKDFMALNAGTKIEIQGHVFAVGDNSLGAQKLSEARAKRVLIYLADHGIDRNRMIAVGYGNTKPIYPNAKLAYEEQANRRVEIVVK
jgi:outer membrane protein OmpA-like peptidoglycan-associated protein